MSDDDIQRRVANLEDRVSATSLVLVELSALLFASRAVGRETLLAELHAMAVIAEERSSEGGPLVARWLRLMIKALETRSAGQPG